MTSELDFQLLNDQLLNLGSVNSISELQGVLCGRLIGGESLSSKQWVAEALSFLDLDYLELTQEQEAFFAELYEATKEQFVKGQEEFMPLLPESNSSLQRRTEELGAWCSGLLHGLGSSGLAGDAQLDATVAEALRDLAQISQVCLESDDDETEEDEASWQELLGYVATVTRHLYEQLSAAPSEPGKPTLH